MAVTAALIAGGAAVAGAGINAYGLSQSGRGAQQSTNVDAAALAQAQNDAVQARINAAYTSKLGQAGYTDNAGNSYSYDPATNTWVSTVSPQDLAVKAAADQATIAANQATITRNTTDMDTARRANALAMAANQRVTAANERTDLANARAQPMIDAAQRRLAAFQPISGNQLGSLLGTTAANANTTAYTPIIQDTLRQFARTGTAAGPVLADIGRRSSADLRQSLIDAQVQGMTQAAGINNANRQGLQTDLTTAIASGNQSTPQQQSFQGLSFPGIATPTQNTSTKDMLTALQNRATGSAYASALGNSSITGADQQGLDASKTLAGSIPLTSPSLIGATQAGQSITDYLKSGDFKSLYGAITGGDNKPYNGPSATDLTNSFGDPATLQTQMGLASNQRVP